MDPSARTLCNLLVRRIWAGTMILLVFLSLVYFYQSTRDGRRELRERARQHVRFSARKLGSILDSAIAVAEIMSVALERHPEFTGSLVRELMELNVKHHSSVVGITVVLPLQTLSLDWESGQAREVLTVPGDWWAKIQRTGEPMWDLPENRPPNISVMAARYCMPIKLDGKVVGAVSTLVTLKSLQSDFETLKREGASYGFVVSPAGTLARLGGNRGLPTLGAGSDSQFVESSNPVTGEKVWLSSEAAGHSGLTVILAYPKSAFWSRVLEAEVRPVLLIILGAFILYILLFKISESISVPIEQLAKTTRRIAQGELELTVACASDAPREVQELAYSFLEMSRELRAKMTQITEEAAHRERLASQMKIAHDIQVSMLPTKTPQIEWLQIAAASLPALTVGGDFYDFDLKEGCLAATFGDISGKGIASAIYMAAVVTLLRMSKRRSTRPCDWLREANLELALDHSGFFATASALMIDPGGHVFISSAGHPSPLWRRDQLLIELDPARTLPLGAFEEATYVDQELDLEPGDVLLFYTDGANEAMDSERQFFEEQRLREAFLLAPPEPAALVQFVLDAVERFRDGAPQNDDLTLLCVTYQGA